MTDRNVNVETVLRIVLFPTELTSVCECIGKVNTLNMVNKIMSFCTVSSTNCTFVKWFSIRVIPHNVIIKHPSVWTSFANHIHRKG